MAKRIGKGSLKVISGEHSASVEKMLSDLGEVARKLDAWEPCKCKCGDTHHTDIAPILEAIKNIEFPSCGASFVCDHPEPKPVDLTPVYLAIKDIRFPEIPEVHIPPIPDHSEDFKVLKEHFNVKMEATKSMFAQLDARISALHHKVDTIPPHPDYTSRFDGVNEQIARLKNAVMAIEIPQPEKCKFPQNLQFTMSQGEPIQPVKKKPWWKFWK